MPSQIDFVTLDIDEEDEEVAQFSECVVDRVEFAAGVVTEIVLKNCTTLSGAALPGIHVYPVVKINSLTVLKSGTGVKVDTSASPAKTPPTTNGRTSGKPIGARVVYRSDNPHLEKLLPLQVNA